MNLRTRAGLVLAGLTTALALGTGSASAAEPPTYGPEWSTTPGTGPEWQPGANPGSADLVDGLVDGLLGH